MVFWKNKRPTNVKCILHKKHFLFPHLSHSLPLLFSFFFPTLKMFSQFFLKNASHFRSPFSVSKRTLFWNILCRKKRTQKKGNLPSRKVLNFDWKYNSELYNKKNFVTFSQFKNNKKDKKFKKKYDLFQNELKFITKKDKFYEKNKTFGKRKMWREGEGEWIVWHLLEKYRQTKQKLN